MPKTPRSPKVLVDVTEEAIDDAVRGDSGHCMIAESLKASCPDAIRVSVDLQSIRFSDPKRGLRYTYLTPRVAQVCLLKFDNGQRPEPFTFQLARGHVTTSRSGHTAKPLTEIQRAARKEMRQARLLLRQKGLVPEPVGGRPAPLNIPYSRRRSFGLRGLGRVLDDLQPE